MSLVLRIDLWLLPLLLLGLTCVVGALVWSGYRLARRAATWRELLLHVPLGVVLFDRTGRQQLANRAASELLGPLDTHAVEQIRQAAGPTPQTALVRGRAGEVVQLQTRRLEPGNDVLLLVRDLSQQQRAEAQHRKFMHTLSHELLTPLTAIQGHLNHAALPHGTDDGARQASLAVVREEVERLTRLTSNLLLLSRLEAGQALQRRPTNLAAVAEEAVLQLLEHADAKHVTLQLNAAPQLARPAVDRDAWKQVFLNLLDNGIKYGHAGGCVELRLAQQNGALVMSVADDGPGIAPDDLPHIFSELFRAEAQRHISGSGLGLAITRRIVEQHGGSIACSSELGHGTTFTITLPLDDSFVTHP
jgi:signal transduction histidine kinase